MFLETLERVGDRLQLGAQFFAVDLLAVGAVFFFQLAEISQRCAQGLAGLGGEGLFHVLERLVGKFGLGADCGDFGAGLCVLGAQDGQLADQFGVGGALLGDLDLGGGESGGGRRLGPARGLGAGAQFGHFPRTLSQFGREMRRVGRFALPEHEGGGAGDQGGHEEDDVKDVECHPGTLSSFFVPFKRKAQRTREGRSRDSTMRRRRMKSGFSRLPRALWLG